MCKYLIIVNVMGHRDFRFYLKKIRERKGLTIRALAKYSDVSNSYISQIERGIRFPSADILKKLAGPLGLTDEFIMREAGYITKSPKPKAIKPGSKEEIKLLVRESFGRYPLSEEAFEEVAEYIGFKLEEHKIQEAKKADK